MRAERGRRNRDAGASWAHALCFGRRQRQNAIGLGPQGKRARRWSDPREQQAESRPGQAQVRGVRRRQHMPGRECVLRTAGALAGAETTYGMALEPSWHPFPKTTPCSASGSSASSLITPRPSCRHPSATQPRWRTEARCEAVGVSGCQWRWRAYVVMCACKAATWVTRTKPRGTTRWSWEPARTSRSRTCDSPRCAAAHAACTRTRMRAAADAPWWMSIVVCRKE